MKKIIASTMMMMVVAGAFAVETTRPYCYASEEVSNYGYGGKQRYDVAILIDNPSLKGKEITAINAYISSAENMGPATVWMSTELGVDKKEIIANVLQEEVTPQAAKYYSNNVGVLTLKLSKPYVYNGEPLYVGYSLTIQSTGQDYQKFPILVSPVQNSNGLWVHTSSSVKDWTDFSEKAGVAVISVDMTGNFPTNAMGVTKIDATYAQIGVPFMVTGMMANNGLSDVVSIGYDYTIDGNTYSSSYTFPEPIVPDLAVSVPVAIPCDAIYTPGYYDMTITINQVNGEPNEAEVISGTDKIGVLDRVLVNRPMVEEFTGLWCGWCPRGFQGMEELGQLYGDEIVILCYHAQDIMTTIDEPPVNVPSFPNATINRTNLTDPYYGRMQGVNFGINQEVIDVMKKKVECDIYPVEFSIDGDMLTITTSAIFGRNINDADYSIGYVLTANGMSSPDWGQVNYYVKYASQYANTPLAHWSQAGNPAYGLIFNDVVVNGTYMNGVAGSLPSTIEFGKEYTNTVTLKCQGLRSLVGKREELPVEINKSVINFFIIDKKTGEIMNANKLHLSTDSTGIDNIVEEGTLVKTVYYDLSGRVVNNPDRGIYIVNKIYDNGKTEVSKIVL